MYCYNCGTKVSDSAKFCQSCGMNLSRIRKAEQFATEQTVIEKALTGQNSQQIVKGIQPKEMKQKKSAKKQKAGMSKKARLILGLSVVIAVIIAVIIFVFYVFYSHRKIADIPDPESFFDDRTYVVENQTYIAESKKYNGSVTYKYTFNCDPAEAVEAYVDLLKSGEYTFKRKKVQHWSDNNSYYDYSYSGNKFYFENEKSDIAIVNYGNDYYNDSSLYVVEFNFINQNNFSMVSVNEKYDWKPDSLYDESYIDTYEGGYEELYEDAYAEVYDTSGAILPDLGLFLGCERDEDKATLGNAHKLSYKFDMDDTGKAAVEEAIDLMEAPGYQLTGWVEEEDFIDTSAILYRNYYYTYMGDAEEISGVKDELGYFYDVHVRVAYYYDKGSIALYVYYSEDFTLEDPGSRAQNQIANYNGGSGNSGSSSGSSLGGTHERYIPEHSKRACNMCGGSGVCEECGGDGLIWSSAADKPNRSCWRCLSDGECRYCNGTGKED